MIPKIVHYCWFGKGEKKFLVQKCIESWKKYLPDYEIIEWNEENFDINMSIFAREAYEVRKWAFVSDYARLYALSKFGGIYLDTDVEILKNFDCLLNNDFFLGYESNDYLGTAVIGSNIGNKYINELLICYNEKKFILENGKLNITPNPVIFTKILNENGIIIDGKQKKMNDIMLYNQIMFYPNNIGMILNKKSDKTFAVHHCEQTWRDDGKRDFSKFRYRLRRYFVKKIQNIIGTKTLMKFKHFIFK